MQLLEEVPEIAQPGLRCFLIPAVIGNQGREEWCRPGVAGSQLLIKQGRGLYCNKYSLSSRWVGGAVLASTFGGEFLLPSLTRAGLEMKYVLALCLYCNLLEHRYVNSSQLSPARTRVMWKLAKN